MEVYGSGPSMNVSHLNRVKPEKHIPNTLIHSVTETFGNNPAHEVNRASMVAPSTKTVAHLLLAFNLCTSVILSVKHLFFQKQICQSK